MLYITMSTPLQCKAFLESNSVHLLQHQFVQPVLSLFKQRELPIQLILGATLAQLCRIELHLQAIDDTDQPTHFCTYLLTEFKLFEWNLEITLGIVSLPQLKYHR